MRLKNKNAVITGGTTGLGFEMARCYLEEGARVLITGRRQENVDSAVAQLGQNGFGVAADASRLPKIEKMAQKAKELFGQVDILIANAGIGVFAPLLEVDEAAFNKQFDLNVKGLFFTVQKIVPLMRKGGSIILISSTVHDKAMQGGSLYTASKAAVRSFARSMAFELAGKGIRVNSLSPGLVPTEFAKNAQLDPTENQQFIEKMVEETPLQRPGKPLEIAQAALFLGSDESSYITAADLIVDGGWGNV